MSPVPALAGLTEVKGRIVLALLLFLTIVWIVLGIIGAVVHGLVWLLVIAAVAFLITWVFGGFRMGKARGKR